LILFQSFGRDLKAIQALVGEFMPGRTLRILEQGLSDDIKEILVEAPYVDKDFRDTYYNDFSKRFMDMSRDSIRLHFFLEKNKIIQENYLGFISLRDTKVYTIGRSYLNPKALKQFEPGFYCLAKYEVQVKGVDLMIEAFPWMEQDGNVTRCAHVAVWGVNRYYSQKKTRYSERFLHEITNHDTATRKVPSKGATVEQIAQILSSSKFAPEIYFRESDSKGNFIDDGGHFDRLVYTYIESGLPCVAGLLRNQHAIAVIGHGEVKNFEEVIKENDGIIDSSKFFQEIIVSNDNHLPYSRAYSFEHEKNLQFEDIDVLIVPFNEKMYLEAGRLFTKILPIFEKHALKVDGEKLVRRVLLTSSNAYKSFIEKFSQDDVYKQSQLCMQMPKFIWIAEYSSTEEYRDELIRHRIIFDATMLNFHDSVYLSIKKQNQIRNNHKNEQKTYLLKGTVEKMYKNNLVKVSNEEGI